ncbi:MAG TPA: di-heme oxidoredictase family protein [Terriglobales bacterium]|nr:di-heme oxidoredictase family protein [Terriglobales bacterium]
MRSKKVVTATLCASVVVLLTANAFGQKDPGPRGGPAAAGGVYPTLNANEKAFFNQAFTRFLEVDSVSGTVPGEDGTGLGPTFNGNSCKQCHAQPAIGGSSPGLASPQNPVPNPQVALATLDGATNTVPSFITANGPVREARFVRNSNGTPDGGVHGLFTIAGRSDAPGCALAQPNFAQQLAANNVIFRIPTPLFGLGLVEMTPDITLRANLLSTFNQKVALGIGGAFNTSGNDGTITRFGWKAQNKSLLIFAGEAYNVEQGVSNELFPNERSAVPGCVFNSSPEDYTNIVNDSGSTMGTASDMSSDVVNFANFMMLSAPATPASPTPSATNGSILFNRVGCALCHSPSLTTGPSRFTGMGNVTYHPYSDFALHHMGSVLADGITQGAAGPEQFRTAPLWGVGQRLFFLHDGRTSDLLQAIQAHSDCNGGGRGQPGGFRQGGGCSSEANRVINNFNSLSPSQQQDILNFLRSL